MVYQIRFMRMVTTYDSKKVSCDVCARVFLKTAKNLAHKIVKNLYTCVLIRIYIYVFYNKMIFLYIYARNTTYTHMYLIKCTIFIIHADFVFSEIDIILILAQALYSLESRNCY